MAVQDLDIAAFKCCTCKLMRNLINNSDDVGLAYLAIAAIRDFAEGKVDAEERLYLNNLGVFDNMPELFHEAKSISGLEELELNGAGPMITAFCKMLRQEPDVLAIMDMCSYHNRVFLGQALSELMDAAIEASHAVLTASKSTYSAHVNVIACIAAFDEYKGEVKVIARNAGVEDQLDIDDDDDWSDFVDFEEEDDDWDEDDWDEDEDEGDEIEIPEEEWQVIKQIFCSLIDEALKASDKLGVAYIVLRVVRDFDDSELTDEEREQLTNAGVLEALPAVIRESQRIKSLAGIERRGAGPKLQALCQKIEQDQSLLYPLAYYCQIGGFLRAVEELLPTRHGDYNQYIKLLKKSSPQIDAFNKKYSR